MNYPINHPIFYPMLAHMLWVAILYCLLTWFRAPAAWGIGANKDGSNPYSGLEQKVSANLSNQFEWPIFFYLICILAIIAGLGGNELFVGLAWVFAFGRFVHSLVQILASNIRLRGLVFTINFIAVLSMWFLFFGEITSGTLQN